MLCGANTSMMFLLWPYQLRLGRDCMDYKNRWGTGDKNEQKFLSSFKETIILCLAYGLYIVL